jgi:5-methylcytosine-specific restriction endonuclease McrA
LEVLARDGWVCRIRAEGCTLTATEVDHVVAVSLGGGVYDPENLRASCATCNRRRGGVLGGSKPSVRRPSREW